MKQEGEACKREVRRKENEVVANESERRSLESWVSKKKRQKEARAHGVENKGK